METNDILENLDILPRLGEIIDENRKINHDIRKFFTSLVQISKTEWHNNIAMYDIDLTIFYVHDEVFINSFRQKNTSFIVNDISFISIQDPQIPINKNDIIWSIYIKSPLMIAPTQNFPDINIDILKKFKIFVDIKLQIGSTMKLIATDIDLFDEWNEAIIKDVYSKTDTVANIHICDREIKPSYHY